MRSFWLRFFLSAVCVLQAHAAEVAQATVTVLATTDLHGTVYPVDYYTERPAPRGLAKIATLLKEARAEAHGALLIDCGDTIQGSPLESVYQSMVRAGRAPLGVDASPSAFPHDPMMLVMNLLGYDAMTLGNHEFNFGLQNLGRARGDARFPWLSANTVPAPGSPERPFQPYLVRSVNGVRVAVIGITTPAVPMWEKPENLGGYRFLPGREALGRAVTALRNAAAPPDVVVVAAHTGLDRPSSPENIVADLAEVPGVDAIVFGHSHREVAGERLGNVLVVQPKNGGGSLARLDFTLERGAGGGWKLTGKTSRLLRVSAATAADPEVLRVAAPYHELAERYLNTPVAQAGEALSGALGRVEDTALVDAIHAVQLHDAQADVSFTALFNPRVRVAAGPVTVRQIAALYIYDNELYAIAGNGRMVKEALENAARYFLSCRGESCGKRPLINTRVMGFNYDMAGGVEYEIDLTRPEGDRVVNLRWKGRPLDPEQPLRIAVNNYRAGGSAGYGMFRGARVLWRSSEEIRDLMVRYYTERGRLPAAPARNWRIVPPEALRTLEGEALTEAKRPGVF